MQSFLIVTPQQFTQASQWQEFLTTVLITKKLLPDTAWWQFVNFPHTLLIDQVRQLQTQARQSGGQATTIFVLTDFDACSTVVQNSLLKILEQPPPTTLFLLTARQATAILPTISSRCQLWLDETTTPAVFTASLADLDSEHWSDLTASQLAQLLTEKLTTIHRERKKTQPDLTLTTITEQALTAYLHSFTSQLQADSQLAWRKRTIEALQQSLVYLHARVSPKNVIYFLALAITQRSV